MDTGFLYQRGRFCYYTLSGYYTSKTDTPSATEVQVNLFIDRFTDQVMQKEQQDVLKMTMGKFLDKALKDSGKKSTGDLTPEQLESVLTSALKISKDQQKIYDQEFEKYMETLSEKTNAKLDDEVARNIFAKKLRDITILGYKTSEYVAENVLVYLPVPGEYVACGNTEELTGGKAWSL